MTTAETVDKTASDKATHIGKRKAYYENRYGEALTAQELDYDMVRSDQWDKKKKEEWKEAGFPTLTNNRIKPKINLLKGNQSQNRLYFKVIPNDEVSPDSVIEYKKQQMPMAQACQLITDELKKIENENDGEYELSDCFADGIICGKAYLEPFIKEDDSVFPPRKYITFKARGYKDCFPDPDAKEYDLSDAQDWMKFVEINRDKLIEMFPKKKSVIDGLPPGERLMASEHTEVRDEDKYKEDQGGDSSNRSDSPLILTEYYYYEEEEEHLLGTIDSGVRPIPEGSKAQIEKMYAAKKQAFEAQGLEYDYKIFTRKYKVWYVCFYSSGELLSEPEKKEIDEVTLIQYCADRIKSIDKIEKRDIGLTRDLVDQQRSYNTLKSLTLAHTASNVSSGIAYEDGAISDTELPKWRKWMSKPGFMGKVARGAIKKWMQIFPNPLNQAVFGMAKDEAQEMEETSLVRPELSGEGGDQSGKALSMMLKQQFMGIHFYFDNFRRTKHALCRKLVKLICYLHDVDYHQLKVVIDDTVESPTTRYANAIETQELLDKNGAMLNSPYGDLVIDGTNLSNKDAWKQRWNEANEFAQWKQEKEMAEKAAIDDAKAEGLTSKGAGSP